MFPGRAQDLVRRARARCNTCRHYGMLRRASIPLRSVLARTGRRPGHKAALHGSQSRDGVKSGGRHTVLSARRLAEIRVQRTVGQAPVFFAARTALTAADAAPANPREMGSPGARARSGAERRDHTTWRDAGIWCLTITAAKRARPHKGAAHERTAAWCIATARPGAAAERISTDSTH